VKPPKKPKKAPGQIAPTEALQILTAGGLSAAAAAETLTTAARRNRCRLLGWGEKDGKWRWRPLPPDYIATSLVIVARIEADGRARAEIVSSRGKAWVEGPHFFEFDAAEVTALLTPPGTDSKKPGRKAKDDWPTLVAAKLIDLAHRDPEMLQNVDALGRHMREFLKDEIGWAPSDPKAIREKLVDLLKFVRR